MNNEHSDLLDQNALKPLTEQEREAVGEAQRAGGSQSSGDTSAADLARAITASSEKAVGNDGENAAPITEGTLNQTIFPGEIEASVGGETGNETDFTGGIANIAETINAPAKQNDYDR
jgi:hypothetical protein